MKYTATTAQLLTVPPNILGFIVVIITAYFSDKVKLRGPFIVAGTLIGICGYLMLLISQNNAVKYAGTFLVATGVFPGSPMLMVGVSSFLYNPLVVSHRAALEFWVC
jgi:hypothetical protein